MNKLKKISAAMTAMMMAAPVMGALPDVLSVTASAYEVSGDWSYSLKNDLTVSIAKYNGSATDVKIPTELDGFAVTEIGFEAFDHCEKIKSITIHDKITVIGGGAFQYCTSLTSIQIPKNATLEGYGRFYGCSSLKSVTLPEGMTTISLIEFTNCSSLTSINIPDSVTVIGNRAFEGCTSLKSITIPDNVTSINNDAFINCTSLETVTIPKSVKVIGWSFGGCTSLKTVNYTGSEDEWNEIQITKDKNIPLYKAKINYNYAPYVQPPLSDNAKQIADVNGDGKVNAKDATEVLKIVAGLSKKDGSKGDVNGDDKINAKDATEILKWIAGMPSALDDL